MARAYIDNIIKIYTTGPPKLKSELISIILKSLRPYFKVNNNNIYIIYH